MTASDIERAAAALLELNAEEEEVAGRMKLAARLAVSEVTEEYFPLRFTESIGLIGGVLPYAAFSRQPVKLYRIESGGGREVQAVRENTGFRVRGGCEGESYTVTYGGAAGEGESFTLPVSLRVLAYGAAGEYCMLSARYEEAALYVKRFQDGLLAAASPSRETVLPARRWT